MRLWTKARRTVKEETKLMPATIKAKGKEMAAMRKGKGIMSSSKPPRSLSGEIWCWFLRNIISREPGDQFSLWKIKLLNTLINSSWPRWLPPPWISVCRQFLLYTVESENNKIELNSQNGWFAEKSWEGQPSNAQGRLPWRPWGEVGWGREDRRRGLSALSWSCSCQPVIDQQGNIKSKRDHMNQDLTSLSLSAKPAVTDASLRQKRKSFQHEKYWATYFWIEVPPLDVLQRVKGQVWEDLIWCLLQLYLIL